MAGAKPGLVRPPATRRECLATVWPIPVHGNTDGAARRPARRANSVGRRADDALANRQRGVKRQRLPPAVNRHPTPEEAFRFASQPEGRGPAERCRIGLGQALRRDNAAESQLAHSQGRVRR